MITFKQRIQTHNLELVEHTPSYMKFSVLPLLVAGAGFAQLVSASPIRIIITEVSSNLRFGHAVANANNVNVAHLVPLGPPTNLDDAGRPKKPHHHSCGGALRNKAILLSNAFRKALGFSVIEDHPRPMKEHIVHFPIHFASGPPPLENEHSHGHSRTKHHHGSFMRRMHHALTALGPWEGRAVAFVLGCGIGVLLRMVWVMCIITYRLIKGGRDEEADYAVFIFEQDPEELVVPPPQYTDEKVEAVEDKSSVATA